jgi:hypothetical protein
MTVGPNGSEWLGLRGILYWCSVVHDYTPACGGLCVLHSCTVFKFLEGSCNRFSDWIPVRVGSLSLEE